MPSEPDDILSWRLHLAGDCDVDTCPHCLDEAELEGDER
jgi:hypothetical protein